VAPEARDIMAPMPASRRAQVLAVDDDADMRQFLLAALRDWGSIGMAGQIGR